LKSKKFSLKLLLEAREGLDNYSDSLQLQITHSDIVILTTQNEMIGKDGLYKFKRSVKVMKVKVAKM
jgi:hypothetical protein